MMPKRSQPFVYGIALAGFLFLAVIGVVTFMPSVFAENHRHSSVTGYFGLDDDGLPIVDRHGTMLVFDGEIAPETVSVDTFEVSLNDGSFAEVVETRVDGAYVFLKLKDELVSDATLIVGIAEGEEVEDLAGNSTNKRKLGFVQIKDGIAPRLTVTLSGGSGIGTGDEGPDRLTRDTIDVRITSDEPLQGAPRVVVVCESLKWTESVDGRDVEGDVNDFIANRNGAFPSKPQEPRGTDYTCGYDGDGDGMDDPFQLTEDIANSRPGEVWEYTWRNPTGAATNLRDGELVVVVYGRDRSRYDRYGEDVSNWVVATGGFGLDTKFGTLGVPEGVTVFPEDGSKTSQERPFVLIEFSQKDTVMLNSVMLNGVQTLDLFQETDDNQFVYWPDGIRFGEYKVEVDASDAAGNDYKFGFEFQVTARDDFVLDLHPGWNAISFPARPIDRFIDTVFNKESIQTVIGWHDGRWRMAIRRDGSWEDNAQYEELTWLLEGYGYWVKSYDYAQQPVALTSAVGRYWPSPPLVRETPRQQGWNFVGVLDLDHDQTEDHFGDALRSFNSRPIFAREYLGDYDIAYTWDPVRAQFDELLPDDPMMIGDGVWVYYAPPTEK